VTFAELSHAVRDHIGQDHRYAHCVRVARLAERLAMTHGAASEPARRAGMLHDLARLYSADRLVRECEERGLAIEAFERRYPIVLHAPLGAELASERFGETDPDVLAAIRTHTLPVPGMSQLQIVLYLADSLEPGREFADRASLERLAFEDLERALAATIESSRAYIEAAGGEVAPATLQALAEMSGRRAARKAEECLN
jgi:predicted HD superfamily hydrolase involved in NAD metabolism